MASKEYHADYYRQNRDKRLKQAKLWKKNNPEARKRHVKAHNAVRRSRKATSEGRALELWRSSRKRGHEFTLTLEFVTDLIRRAKTCPYTGIVFDFSVSPVKGFKNPWAPSLDRINSAEGYTPNNVEVTSVWWNIAKSEWSPEVMAAALSGLQKRKDPRQ